MLIKQRLIQDGNFLFRWRSYLPLLLLPLFLVAIPESVRMERELGELWSTVWTCVSVAVAFFGLAIRIAVVGVVPAGTSGRNTLAQKANHLNTGGLYSVVRNPLYFGNLIGLVGFVAVTKVGWLLAIACLAYWLYIERIIAAEEAFLERIYGEQYRIWALITPCFFPKLKNWRSPDLPFSIRTVLRREYNGLAALGTGFFIWSLAVDVIDEGKSMGDWYHDDFGFVVMFVLTVGTFVLFRSLKRHSRLLHEQGR